MYLCPVEAELTPAVLCPALKNVVVFRCVYFWNLLTVMSIQTKLQSCRSIVHSVRPLKNSWKVLDINIQMSGQLLQAKVRRSSLIIVLLL